MNNLAELPKTYTDYLLLYIVSSKSNPNYIKLKGMLEDKNRSDQFNNKKINVVENIINDEKKFEASLFNVNMSLLMKFDSISDDNITKIFEISDKYGPKNLLPNTAQKGGNESYEHKYKKYKQKHNDMKKIATSYLRPNFK